MEQAVVQGGWRPGFRLMRREQIVSDILCHEAGKRNGARGAVARALDSLAKEDTALARTKYLWLYGKDGQIPRAFASLKRLNLKDLGD